jgi:hypothetical protein
LKKMKVVERSLATGKKLEHWKQLANGWPYPATRNAAVVRRGGMMRGVPLSEVLDSLNGTKEPLPLRLGF